MQKRWKHIVRLVVLSSTLLPLFTSVFAPVMLLAQDETKQTFKIPGQGRKAFKLSLEKPAEATGIDLAVLASAYAGDAAAQLNVGFAYDKGEVVRQDYAKAEFWYRKAANQGDAWGQYRLGCMYQFGRGVSQSFAVAADWDEKAAENGGIGAGLSDVQASLAEIRENQRKQQYFAVCVVIVALLITSLIVTIFRYRMKLIGYGKKVVPRSTRAKQLAVLLPVASWCSACCLYEVLHPLLMIHPINAAVTAMLLSTPALVFGAVFIWWLSQGKRPD